MDRERERNRLELTRSVVFALLWATIPAAGVLHDERHANGAALLSLRDWFPHLPSSVPLPFAVFASVFGVALSVHLLLARLLRPREPVATDRVAVLAAVVLALAFVISR